MSRLRPGPGLHQLRLLVRPDTVLRRQRDLAAASAGRTSMAITSPGTQSDGAENSLATDSRVHRRSRNACIAR
ncbi:hypothetical protein GCM10010109_81210 [Actinoplanes campanulatus]|nr:hypothetical protein GCM10010109_81210 [Actinoplanes campanulatus]GID41171.1 hypothetical protein Aca09nite_76770 [Actinoplanes campanulatus]